MASAERIESKEKTRFISTIIATTAVHAHLSMKGRQ
jgi:hypothetical protein